MESTTKKSALPIVAGILMAAYLMGSITQMLVSLLLPGMNAVSYSLLSARVFILFIPAAIAMVVFLFMQKKGIPMIVIQGVFCLNVFVGMISSVSNMIRYNSNGISNLATSFVEYLAVLTGSLISLVPYAFLLILSIIGVKSNKIGGFGKTANVMVIVFLAVGRFLTIFTLISYAIIGSWMIFGTQLYGWFNGFLLDAALVLTCKWLSSSSFVNQASENLAIENNNNTVFEATTKVNSEVYSNVSVAYAPAVAPVSDICISANEMIELKNIKELLDLGIITQEEFDERKEKISVDNKR